MAFGFGKKSGNDLSNLALMGSMGLAAVAPPIGIPALIAATMFGHQKNAESEEAQKVAREQAMQDFVSNKGGAGYEPSSGITWNQDRPGFQQEQMARLAQFAPDVAVRQRMGEMFPEKETFGQPMAVAGPDGNQAFAAFGNRGGVNWFDGPTPVNVEKPVGPRGWFQRVRDGIPVGAPFQAHENSPGTRKALGAGEWVLAQEPSKDKPLTPIQEYEQNIGKLEPGMTVEIGQDGRPTNRQIPIPGTSKDPSVIEQRRKLELTSEMPKAKSAFIATARPLRALIGQIRDIKKDPNTRDVVGAWEGGQTPRNGASIHLLHKEMRPLRLASKT